MSTTYSDGTPAVTYTYDRRGRRHGCRWRRQPHAELHSLRSTLQRGADSDWIRHGVDCIHP
ncbi:MAG: hypothetical protein HS122_14070 [Opitutaceae bacterium]|nr:hypothetical protein [Opitutaceae bacterium]